MFVLHFDKRNTDACKVFIAADFVGLQLVAKEVDAGAKVVEYLSSNRLPVLSLPSGEHIFSSNAASRLVWNVGKKSDENHANDDVWLEWEATYLKPSIDSLMPPGASGRVGTLKLDNSFNTVLFQFEEHLRPQQSAGPQVCVSSIAIWCTLLRLFSVDTISAELQSLFPAVSAWFSHLACQPAFRSGLQRAGLKEPATLTALPPANAEAVDYDELKRVFKDSKWHEKKPRQKPLLPQEGERNILVTSALPYVNNVPHLGNVIGCVLSADVYTRFCRLRDYNVLYICGTDEYGTATETKAIEEGLTPQEICDKYNKLHCSIYEWFNISFDHFGRTTTTQQTQIAQDIFWDLYKNNYVTQESIDQLLCEKCNRFLADRFVEGTCPFCAYPDARGDQCDKCGKLINAIELKNPQCKLCRSTPVIKSSRHLFLDLPQLVDKLTEHLSSAYQQGIWSPNAKTITDSWIKSGLKPRCISRDLKWGTPVPLEGFTEKVFYVWYDAPIGYISITANYTDEWERWWKNPSQVQLYNFMAKDNVPFHSVIFPCSLLGTGKPWTVVTNLSATEYLNYEDGKFSKSRGLGVFGDSAAAAGLDADIFRFYLLYVRPETQDSVFSWDDLMMKNNSELLGNLGNFVNRGLTFVTNKFNNVLPRIELAQQECELLAGVTSELCAYIDCLERIRLRDGIRHILSISSLGNGYIQANKPWDLLKGTPEDVVKAGTVASLSCNLSYLLAVLLWPYMPSVAETILKQLNANDPQHIVNGQYQRVLEGKFVQFLPEGHRLGKPEPLFKKIEQLQAQALKEKYGGQQKKETSEAPTAAVPDKDQLKLQVDQQADLVRKLKADKAEKSKIDSEVTLLLSLKKQLALVDGSASNAPPGDSKQTAKSSNEKKSNAKGSRKGK